MIGAGRYDWFHADSMIMYNFNHHSLPRVCVCVTVRAVAGFSIGAMQSLWMR